MKKVKAKDINDWKIWHYGFLENNCTVHVNGQSVSVVPRTVCEDTGLVCKGKDVYENDWLELEGNGEKHKYLVVWAGNVFCAAEDDEHRYNLQNVVNDETCRIVGNIYD